MSFAVNRGTLFCTPEDVRIKSALIMSKIADAAEDEENQIFDSQIEAHIIQASALVEGILEGIYGGPSALLVDTPYSNRPYRNIKNSTQIYLTDIQIASGAITEKWTVDLLTPTAAETIKFNLTGTVSGSQGSGTSAAVFPSTNGFVNILTTYWINPLSEKSQDNEQIYFSTYNVKPSILYITSCLAAGNLLNAELSEMSPNASSLGNKLIAEATKWLEKYANPDKSGVSLTSTPTIAIETIAIPSQINTLGEDVTDYDSAGIGKDNPDAIGYQ